MKSFFTTKVGFVNRNPGKKVLAVDVGATKIAIALFDSCGRFDQPIHVSQYPSRDFLSFESLLEKLAQEYGPTISGVVIGVPGPLIKGEVKLTNLPWIATDARLSCYFPGQSSFLVNDVQGAASILSYVDQVSTICIHKADRALFAPQLLLSFGTGVGGALRIPSQQGSSIFPLEPGAILFPVEDARDYKLVCDMGTKITFEAILGAGGLSFLYRFLGGGHSLTPDHILECANQGEVPAQEAFAWYFKIMVRLIQQLSFALLPTGGIYLSGGVLQKCRTQFDTQRFEDLFLRSAVLPQVIQNIPLNWIDNPHMALIGLFHYWIEKKGCK